MKHIYKRSAAIAKVPAKKLLRDKEKMKCQPNHENIGGLALYSNLARFEDLAIFKD